MPDLTTAIGEFETRAGADDAVERLVQAGFHRSDIDVGHRGHVYVIEVQIRPQSRLAAQREFRRSRLLGDRAAQIAVLSGLALAGAALLRWARRSTDGAHR